ncbi:MAG: hypothetical protein M1450_03035 [Patescibacteria group bacterium]|nr:hypothetical protein [Patescibacteria group bacterium]
MKKLLPFIILIVFLFQFFLNANNALAQVSPSPSVSPSPTAPLTIATPGPTDIPAGVWNDDPEVTFVGKVGARSGAFLDWALKEYQWSSKDKDLRNFWTKILQIVYAFSILFVLITAFIMIITRGRSITVMRFIPRFILVILLTTFSFTLIAQIYQTADLIQGHFLKNKAGDIIQQGDLLYIGFDYETFKGYKLSDPNSIYDESAFVSLLLVKLTAITYYAMTGILLLRKVILWFFIILSPVFPLLLLYRPVRNTGKIWIGEFFRWVLYAPLFAIFLSGLVKLWSESSQTDPGIPLKFEGINEAGTKIVYPTAVNILLGGPGQQLSITNSVNIPQTFALYVVALLMLWVVILLPFILLQIFLDYLHSVSFSELAWYKQIASKTSPFLSKYGLSGPPLPPPAPGTPPQPLKPAGAGLARALPISNKMDIGKSADTSTLSDISSNISKMSTTLSTVSSRLTAQLAQQNREILHLTSLSLPTMKDVAKFETSVLSKDIRRHEESARMHETLEKIANPRMATTAGEKERYTKLRERLVAAKQSGNPMAVSILAAAGHVAQKETGVKLPTSVAFPSSNRVQSVSLDDYESVKSMWKENYQKMEAPKELNGIEKTKEQWLKQEIDTITKTINYLMSNNEQIIKQGMDMVAKILPFLLIGGFSHDEVIAYLKAKLEAAKTVLEESETKKEEEETLIEAKHVKTEKPKEMEMKEEAEKELPENDKGKDGKEEKGEEQNPEEKKEGAID